MAKRIINTSLTNSNQEQFTFELWDLNGAPVPLDYIVEFAEDGFSINWDSHGNTYSPIIGSKMECTMFITETQRSVIMPLLYGEQEFNACVVIKKGGANWWTGIVHAEEISEVIGDGYITVTLGASDGLGMLKNFDFKDVSGNKLTGTYTARDILYEVLKKIPSTPLWATTASVFMQEWPINQPVIAADSYLFSNTDLLGDNYGVLDYLRMKPNTFYNAPKEGWEKIGSELLNVKRWSEEEFYDCHTVVESVMASLGASLCFAEGKWQVWDFMRDMADHGTGSDNLIQYSVTSGGLLESSLTTANRNVFLKNAYAEVGVTAYEQSAGNQFRRGATRQAAFPFRGAVQEHIQAGSDVIASEGLGWTTFGNLLNFDTDSTNTYDPVFGGSKMKFPNAFPILNRLNFDIDEISIADGANNGEIRMNISGDVKYEKNQATKLMTCRLRVAVTSNGTDYRLSRPVRTIKYTSTSTSGSPVLFGVTVSGTPAQTGTYYPKYWQGAYEWVPDSDPRYSDAWLEWPLGANQNIAEEGITSRFLQTDYPNIEFFTPPNTRVGGNDNELDYVNDDDRRTFVWRHDYTYETPTTGASITNLIVDEFHLCEWNRGDGPNLLYDINGTLQAIGTNSIGGMFYRTPTLFGVTPSGTAPQGVSNFRYSGAVIYNGDGTNEFDSTAAFIAATPKGYDIAQLPPTMLGASLVNTGNSVHGRYLTSSFSDYSTTEDNMKLRSPWDTNLVGDSFSSLVCETFMQSRYRVRQTVSGSLFQPYKAGSEIVYPYNRLVANRLSPNTETYAVNSCQYQLRDGEQRLELYVAPQSAETNIAGTTQYSEESGGKGKGGTNGGRPAGNDTDAVFDGKVLSIEDITEHFDASGMVGSISITEIQDKINKVQTTNPITDDDLGGGGSTGKFGDIFPIFIKRF